MKWPVWTDPAFVDAAGVGGLTAGFGFVCGSISALRSAVFAGPGLLYPEAMTVGFSTNSMTVGLPLPWGLVTSGGVIVHAHGTQTGTDTQSYSVNFASLIP